jgi:hypothetical protein
VGGGLFEEGVEEFEIESAAEGMCDRVLCMPWVVTHPLRLWLYVKSSLTLAISCIVQVPWTERWPAQVGQLRASGAPFT